MLTWRRTLSRKGRAQSTERKTRRAKSVHDRPEHFEKLLTISAPTSFQRLHSYSGEPAGSPDDDPFLELFIEQRVSEKKEFIENYIQVVIVCTYVS